MRVEPFGLIRRSVCTVSFDRDVSVDLGRVNELSRLPVGDVRVGADVTGSEPVCMELGRIGPLRPARGCGWVVFGGADPVELPRIPAVDSAPDRPRPSSSVAWSEAGSETRTDSVALLCSALGVGAEAVDEVVACLAGQMGSGTEERSVAAGFFGERDRFLGGESTPLPPSLPAGIDVWNDFALAGASVAGTVAAAPAPGRVEAGWVVSAESAAA